jgi:tetratricopeptide (TPR) repeat protein
MKRSRGTRGQGAAAAKAGRAVDEGLALLEQNRRPEAAARLAQALGSDPSNLDALAHLGHLFVSMGKQASALSLYRRLLALRPRHALLLSDVGVQLGELGHWREATAALQAAVALAPSDPQGLLRLGQILVESGRRADAIAPLERAAALDPMSASVQYVLHQALWDDAAPRPAIAALTRALIADPAHVWARFTLGVALGLTGDARAASQHHEILHPDPAVFRGAVDSWGYASAHRTPSTRFFVTTHDTLGFAAAQASLPGPFAELGVRFGRSTRQLAQAGRPLHGFDSFEGLPEAWHILAQGAYSTQGERPEVPPNVTLHVGLFDETLPPFVASADGPLSLVNVDCDLYSSTRSALRHLAPLLVAGTVLVFDEYLVNDAWREDEYKAFQEVVAERGWRYEYLAFSLITGQAVVRLL